MAAAAAVGMGHASHLGAENMFTKEGARGCVWCCWVLVDMLISVAPQVLPLVRWLWRHEVSLYGAARKWYESPQEHRGLWCAHVRRVATRLLQVIAVLLA